MEEKVFTENKKDERLLVFFAACMIAGPAHEARGKRADFCRFLFSAERLSDMKNAARRLPAKTDHTISLIFPKSMSMGRMKDHVECTTRHTPSSSFRYSSMQLYCMSRSVVFA